MGLMVCSHWLCCPLDCLLVFWSDIVGWVEWVVRGWGVWLGKFDDVIFDHHFFLLKSRLLLRHRVLVFVYHVDFFFSLNHTQHIGTSVRRSRCF